MNYFVGERLQPSALRFNPSSITARHLNPRQGMKIYGPYDSGTLGKDQIVCAVVYAVGLQKAKGVLINGLVNGNGQFTGFQSLFRIPLSICSERALAAETPAEVQRTIQSLPVGDLDLVLVLASSRNEPLYSTVKGILLGSGVPSQVVTAQKMMSPEQLPWTLENIALQCYAKVGGTPWTVASTDKRRELVIGISRAQDRKKNYIVGFVTLFTHDGDYQFLYSMAPKPIDWERMKDYRDGLSQLIVDAYEEYRHLRGDPESIVLHLCKRPGRFREVEAAQQALSQIGKSIPYALVHLNDGSNYRLFDTSHPTYIPQSGLKVELSDYGVLLLLDGRAGDQPRRRRGMPRVLEVSMDCRSTMPNAEFPRLVRQVFDFARVNWRGFNAQAIPATLNYSYLVARLVVEIGADRWNPIACAVRLRDKAWFL